VLDPLFKPATGEKDLFEVKQKYIYAVFKRVFQTSKGEALVQSYKVDANAQRVLLNCMRMASGIAHAPECSPPLARIEASQEPS